MSDDDYETIRKKNIAERNAVLAEFLKEVKSDIEELKKTVPKRSEDAENQPPRKRRRTVGGNTDSFRANVRVDFVKKYNTRSRAKLSYSDGSNDSDDDNSSEDSRDNRRGLKVLFPWAKPFQRSIDLMKMGVCDVDEEEEAYSDDDDFMKKKKFGKVAKTPYDPDKIPSVDEITDEMLENIAERSTQKIYCKVRGTSCHQCRQKTLDTKTVCRSGECVGVRGQFCGPCLRGRYGENAVEALKDPDWACPPCRGLCNCSICRTRSGLPPTGILAPVAQEEGFSSVMDYLQSTEAGDT